MEKCNWNKEKLSKRFSGDYNLNSVKFNKGSFYKY